MVFHVWIVQWVLGFARYATKLFHVAAALRTILELKVGFWRG